MSLYYDAVGVLTAPASTGGSFKSRLYNSRTLKASPAQVYALVVEAAKWDILLKEVIDNAGILKLEPKLTPLLALLLVHDHLLAKNGIAATATHPLRQAVERHKIRLKAEFTKARVRRSCATIPELKEAVRREKLAFQGSSASAVYPRWVRINNVRTTMEDQLKTTFASFQTVDTLDELVVGGDEKQKRMRVDPHIPDLLAVAPGVDFSTSPAYKNGEIILQDKASCFPAYMLLGEDWEKGDLVDGCAAPGNKTTHMASLLYKARANATGRRNVSSKIISMDASAVRAKTLQKMVATAGADRLVTVLPGQDFLALDPEDPRFEDVTGLLLDPSCSGSGIIGRDDVPTLILPAGKSAPTPTKKGNQSKKRKRNEASTATTTATQTQLQTPTSVSATDENDTPSTSEPMNTERLLKLSNLQTRIVTHALSFPAATHISYSTCSIHIIENEAVVRRVLDSDIARRRGWRVLRRDEQPAGLRNWEHRGIKTEEGKDGERREVELSEEELQGCLRCWPGDEEGTGGFFVVGFVRDGDCEIDGEDDAAKRRGNPTVSGSREDEDEDQEDDEWEGFSD
ncbi:S-adenosyl-L-methionine-dependent methyltransferase [Aspergillus pseudodeflectus]|uniref:S-adenosyl-L-methionine-dependent methyltransferase n=1 Tax=Aspergillus pseudodeflectus TaxID=176178 RepID=A0ABR4KPB3_9EURO